VAMRRLDREVDNWFKRRCAALFYKSMKIFSNINLPQDVGDFRLMSRQVVDIINQLPETNRCMKGIFAWAGFKTTFIDYSRENRAHGTSKWPLLKLIGLAIDGITAHSTAPLRVATVVGSLIAMVSISFALFTLLKTLIIGDPVQGFPTLMTCIAFLGGTQLIAIGVLGEYVGRTFQEVKHRPLYIVESYFPPGSKNTNQTIVTAKKRELS